MIVFCQNQNPNSERTYSVMAEKHVLKRKYTRIPYSLLRMQNPHTHIFFPRWHSACKPVPSRRKIKSMFTIEHLGIAVVNLEDGETLFSKILNTTPYKREEVESEGVVTSFFQTGESKVELLAATRDDSPIAKYLEKKGPGIHHVAFAVKDIKAEMARLEKEGFQLINQEPKRGADNKWICFLHPKNTSGVLIELCQEVRDSEDGF